MKHFAKVAVVRLRTHLLLAAGILTLSATAFILFYKLSFEDGYRNLGVQAATQLDLYASNLESELKRHEYVPSLVELNPYVMKLLGKPNDKSARELASGELAKLSVRIGTPAIFVLNSAGVGIASSNWYLPESVIDKDLSSQPFFREVIQYGYTGYFLGKTAQGSVTADYFSAQAIRSEGRIQGVAIAKVSLSSLEATWMEYAARSNGDKLLILDENDVAILTSVHGWKFRTAKRLVAAERGRLADLGQYPSGNGALEPLNFALEDTLMRGAAVVRVPAKGWTGPSVAYVTHERSSVRPGWKMILFTDASSLQANAIKTGAISGALVLSVAFLLLYGFQYRRGIASRLAARDLLQQAHDELGRRVDERTAELQQTNLELVREIVEREKTEDHLRETQEELLQAGKMALLGQMSTGMTHEINQPLTALRALSDNARLLLQRGRHEEVEKNLKAIAELTERMAKITSQLKIFARKASAVEEPVLLQLSMANVLFLLENKIRSQKVNVRNDIPEDIKALCDGNRLEQVLVNLLANSLDAMKDVSGEKTLSVRAWRQLERVVFQVSDTGPGIPDKIKSHLFEPFFTTKPPGEGLGLGLVISANIVREFKGSLQLVDSPVGATFQFELKYFEEAKHG